MKNIIDKTKKVLRIAGLICALIWVVWGSYQIGAFDKGRTLVAYAQTATSTSPIEMEAPVLQRISDCESGTGKAGSAHQFNKDGTIVMHQNANGSIDIGYMEINLTVSHINEAAKLQMDLTTEEGNKSFGKWIYENEGTDPWNSSAHCWKI